MMKRMFFFFLLAAIPLSACTVVPEQQAGLSNSQVQTTESEQVLPSIARNVSIQLSNSQWKSFQVEVADTPQSRETGLMNRKELPQNQGMLFIFNRSQPQIFWMKNTLIPLDMIFIDDNWKIVHIAKMSLPCKADPCPLYVSGKDAGYVLEINGGLSDELGITEGALIRSFS